MSTEQWSWNPDPQGVAQIVELLLLSRQPDTVVQERVVIGLAELSSREDFPLYLMFVFNCGDMNPFARQSAGLYLKNCLVEMYCSYPEHVKQALKAEALRSIGDECEPVRNTVGIVVSEIVELELGFEKWPNLLPGVTDLLTNSNDVLVHGALGVVEKLCEDHCKYVRQDQVVLEKLFPNLINLFGSPHEEFMKMALRSVNQFLLDMPGAFLANLSRYVEGTFYLANNKNPQIRQLVCTAFTLLVERRVENVRSSLPQIVEYILHHTSPNIQSPVALEACEFWISIADTDVCQEIITPILPQLLNKLFDCLILTDAEITLTETGGFNSTEGGGEVGGGWNLRKCAAMCFEDLATALGTEFVQALLPLVQKRINYSESKQEGQGQEGQQQFPDWKIEESCVLCLGKIAQGCGDQLTPLFDSILPILSNKLSHPSPHLRSISCWALGAYSPWICLYDSYFPPILEAILEKVHDEDARVKVAGCAALGELLDNCMGDKLDSFFFPILNCLMMGLGKYPAGLLPKLYDPLTSLFENLGEGGGEGERLVGELLPLLLGKLGELEDEDVGDLSPLFGCLAAVISHESLGKTLKEKNIGQPLFEKSIRVMQGCLERDLEETEDCEMLYDCLSLLSGLTCGLKQDVLPILRSASNPPFGALLFACMKRDVSLVRQNSFSLIGDLAKYTPTFFEGAWEELVKILVDNLQLVYPVVCNNAAWALVAISFALSDHFVAFLSPILDNFVFLIDCSDVQPSLASSLTLALGHLCSAVPAGMGAQFDIFLEKWCETISQATDSEEKELSFRGICAAIRTNPSPAYACLEPLVRSFYEYREEASEEIAMEMQTILKGLIGGAPSNWEQMMREQLASPELMQFLKEVCN